MQLITTYAGGAYYNNKAKVFKYYTLYLLTNRLYSSPVSVKAFDTWVQKGSITKTGKPNEIS